MYVAQEAAQDAQAVINRAKGNAEAQRLLAETLRAQGGELVLQKEAIEAWRQGGSQMPRTLVTGGEGGGIPFLFNLGNINPEDAPTPEEVAPSLSTPSDLEKQIKEEAEKTPEELEKRIKTAPTQF